MVNDEGVNLPQETRIPFEKRQPIGEVILGNVDPSTLTREQFEQSQDLLFHGGRSAHFSRDIDYQVFTGPNSQTVGDGYYTTPSRTSAEFYARLRVGPDATELPVVAILPYKARMLDQRDSTHPEGNAPVPLDFVKRYWAHIKDHFESKFPPGFVPDYTTRPLPKDTTYYMSMNQYRNSLANLIGGNVLEGKPIDLRAMLSITGSSQDSEFASRFFSTFMINEGYDGVIFNEGGDHIDQEESASHIFYNLNAIGDYDTWHRDQPVQPTEEPEHEIGAADIRKTLEQFASS